MPANPFPRHRGVGWFAAMIAFAAATLLAAALLTPTRPLPVAGAGRTTSAAPTACHPPTPPAPTGTTACAPTPAAGSPPAGHDPNATGCGAAGQSGAAVPARGHCGPDTTGIGGPRETAASAWPAYASSVRSVSPGRLGASWHRGCPVDAGGLRSVTVRYVGFDGEWRDGELVVAADLAVEVARAFGVLYAMRFPIRQIRTVENFGASDDASMSADNTSAFNCRAVTGGTGWSNHAYGRAIDINPRENPYLKGNTVLPTNATLDRHVSGAVTPAVVAAFPGWTWGGTWTNPTDYQHFEHRR